MKINWRIRFKNPLFVVQLILAAGVPMLAYYGLTAQDLTTWVSLFNMVWEAVKNPYVLGTIFIGLYNALTDPTVEGLSDSKQALDYEKPRKGDE